jgi:DNA-binding NtrC family response regulator
VTRVDQSSTVADESSTARPDSSRAPAAAEPVRVLRAPGIDTETGSSLHDQLRALGTERLVELVLTLASRNGGDLASLLRAMANTSVPAREEGAEPYMVGASPAMQRVYDSIRKFGATNAPVLITGESGTGKELVARAIHERSAYAAGPFVVINCAALPPTLIAAELFGYEKGAFTGATQRRIGRLESANRGTIFLDEIGDLPLEQQTHLLRFLQEHTIDRVGATRPTEVDARVVVATNADLRQAISQGRFREDLFYRLNVLNLHLPPLRDRGEDLDLLATFFLRKFSSEHGREISGFSEDAWGWIRRHDWPGNVRELIGCIRRAVVMADAPCITGRDLGLEAARPLPTVTRAVPASIAMPNRHTIDEAGLRAALATYGGHVSNAARGLGISRTTIYRLMNRFGIS